MRKPYFWKARGAWYVRIGKSQVYLADDETKAYNAWNRMREASATGPDATASSIANRFLTWAEGATAKQTFALYGRYVAAFCQLHGHHPACEVRPFHVTEWLDKAGWNSPSRRQAIISIRRCFSWATQEGLLERNPIAGIKAPAVKRREKAVTSDEHARIASQPDGGQAGRDGAFRAFASALFHSGARPGLVARVTAANVSEAGDAWVFQDHKTRKKTNRPLVVWLSPCLQTLTRIMASRRKTGPLFLNSRDEPWTRSAIRQRMMRLRKKLGLPAGTTSYGYRHGFITRSLVNGVDIATVAELAGHTDTRMIAAHYSHLSQESDHMRAAAAKSAKRA